MSIECRDIRIQFGDQKVLDQISLTLNKSELVFLLGKSGTGKSVLLKAITGFLPLNQGEIWVQGKNIQQYFPSQLHELRKICGLVLQQPALFDFMTVFDNIAFSIRDYPKAYQQKIVEENLRLVHLPFDIMKQKPEALSFGMQKRVSLARTLVLKPQILLFDEPTTGLDPITSEQINSLICEISKKLFVSTLVVSHDIEGALKWANRILFLDEGKLIANDPPALFVKREDDRIQQFVKGCILC
jgi:phospholipid/cholesterol/gamma-HCH transport system ATP-binding protein